MESQTELNAIQHLFNEDTAFIELLIEAELNGEQEYNQLLVTLEAQLKEMHEAGAEFTEHEDYIVLIKEEEHVFETVVLDLVVSGLPWHGLHKKIPFLTYAEQVELRISDTINEPYRETRYPLSALGLYSAIQKYRELAFQLESL